ncbi:hypothetical protein [Chromobacterium vaccinii]|uniref:hypothetical protein n=1 Tax=Chromobacterium vaccinii TaxID=1108595 RepID=UPI001185EAD1|nr:hypothetical protein [Chromobacterium vaccinii]
MDKSIELAALIRCLGDTDDPMNQLVRFHSLTELYLDALISRSQSASSDMPRNGFVSYSRKLKVVEKNVLISPFLCESLKALTAIRNELSHNPFAYVSDETLNNIVRPFPERVRRVRNALPDEKLSPRQMAMVVFIELTTYLWGKDEHAEMFANYSV